MKRYLALNAIMFEGEVEEVERTIVAAKPYVDAFIASDWGVISLCRRHGAAFHVSTQMSTSNSVAARFLAEQGANVAKRRVARYAFSSWRYLISDDDLRPAGLLGPVKLAIRTASRSE